MRAFTRPIRPLFKKIKCLAVTAGARVSTGGREARRTRRGGFISRRPPAVCPLYCRASIPTAAARMERNWQYFIFLAAGVALLLFFMRRRGRPGVRGQGLVAFAIFIVLGVLLLFNALSPP